MLRRASKTAAVARVMALTLIGGSARAQHAGHDMSAMHADSAAPMRSHLMVQAIPLATRANPSAGGMPVSQAVVTQLVAMLRTSFASGHGSVAAALDGEGLTMPNGELNTGGYGEGFVDRRHPHTYVHELMLTGQGSTGAVSWSASAGRGFAPFGTDDPMMRPLVKFPINHHLGQLLERAAAIAALHAGPITLEGGTFEGDEPTHPSSMPRASRFGDSWSTRATFTPRAGMELQASHARVASPEEITGVGLDQRKQSISARTIAPDGNRYLLVEWAKTIERDAVRKRDVFGYESVLAEAAVSIRSIGTALRLEQSERPEEDRLSEPFRTPRPSADLSINGITRWRTATLHVAAPAIARGEFFRAPFVELAVLSAQPRNPQSLYTPQSLYRTSHFTMLTAGFRFRFGGAHARMGRYGVADLAGPPIGSMSSGAPAHMH